MSYGNFVGVFKPFPVKIELRDLNGKIVKDEDNNTIYEEKLRIAIYRPVNKTIGQGVHAS